MESPYLEKEKRLAKIIAAIQVMATYKFYKCDFETWSDRIFGNKLQGKELEGMFKDHPEFFRLDNARSKASLVWRRNYPKNFNVDKLETITKAEFLKLDEKEKMRISRTPLRNDDISTLIKTAVGLHEHALKMKQEGRWWIPLFLVLIGGLFGLIPFILEKIFS